MKRLAPWLLLAGLVLTIFGSKLWLINTASGDLPTMDEWDAISETVLRPWADHQLGFSDLFRAHNEHRLATTKLYALGLTAANGQWSALVETTANAAIHTACALALLLLARRWLSGRHLVGFAVLLLALFASPYTWENTLSGFQVQFYFLLLFSLGHIALSLRTDRFGFSWALGQLSGALALASMASGMISSAAILVVLGWRLLRTRKLAAQPAATAAIAATFAAIGWLTRASFPAHDALKAHEPTQFLAGLAQLLAWPGPAWLPWVFAPALWAGYRHFRQRTAPPADAVLAGLFAWSLLQMAALTYGRGGGGYLLSSRYLDLLPLNLALGYVLLVRHAPDRARRTLVGVWLGLVVLLIAAKGQYEYQAAIAPNAANHLDQEKNLRAYLRTGNTATILGKTIPDIPYPDSAVLVHRLESPTLRRLLPPSIRPSLALTGERRSPPQALPAGLPDADLPIAVSTYSAGAERLTWRSAPRSDDALPLLRFRIAGDLGRPGARLALVVRSADGVVPVEPDAAPGLRWKYLTIRRPAGPWTVEVSDEDPRAWFAVTEPVEIGWLSWLAEKTAKNHALLLGAGLILLGCGALPAGWTWLGQVHWRPQNGRAAGATLVLLLAAGALGVMAIRHFGGVEAWRFPTPTAPAESIDLQPLHLRGQTAAFPSAANAVPQPEGSALWAGTCIDGDKFTGAIETSVFVLKSPTVVVPVLGYPTRGGNHLECEVLDAKGAVVRTIAFAGNPPGEQPAAWHLEIPDWSGRRARLVLTDRNPDHFGWFAVGRPQFHTATGASWRYGAASNLGWFAIAIVVVATLLFVPGLALITWWRERFPLGAATLAVPGLLLAAALGLAVWLLADEAVDSLVLIWIAGYTALTVALAAAVWRRGLPVERADLAALGVYAAVVLGALAFAVFPPSVAQEIGARSPARGRMIASPPDHAIPYNTANYLAEHKDGREDRVAYFGDDWAITSRGPLAPLGIAAAFAVLGETPAHRQSHAVWPADDTGFYVARIFGILTNALVVLGAAALVARLAPRAERFTLVWLASAPLIAINTDFLWPKLLASFFLCLALAAMVADRPSWRAGVWAALAYLSHPVGGLFAPVLVLFLIFRRRQPVARAVVAMTGFGGALLVCLLPWLAYKVWVGWPETMLRYPLGDGRGFALAADAWTWLLCRWQNFWFTFVPGAFYCSGQMTSWLEGALSEPLRWAIGYAKSLPGAVGLGGFALVLLALARRPADEKLAGFRNWLLAPAALVLLVFWGYSADGLGRNCLEPLAVLVIVYAAATWETLPALPRWLLLLAAVESLSVRAIGVLCARDFTVGVLDGGAIACGAVVIGATLAPAIWLLVKPAPSTP